MTKLLFQVSLFAIIIYGCGSETTNVPKENPDLEMEVINDILPQLIPEHPPCTLAPIEGEKPEEYDMRLEAFYREVDSIGKKIEIVSLLTRLDSNYIEAFKRMENLHSFYHLLNAPNTDRRIDSRMLNKIKNVKTILVTEPRKTAGGGLTDCYTLGQVNISRVGFNKDSTKAAFKYHIDNGSCFIENGGIINAEFRNGKWQIIK